PAADRARSAPAAAASRKSRSRRPRGPLWRARPRTARRDRRGRAPASAPEFPPSEVRGGNPPALRPARGVLASPRSRRPSMLLHPGLAGAFREIADPADIGLPLGDRDDTAGIEKVEDVARLDRKIVCRDRT